MKGMDHSMFNPVFIYRIVSPSCHLGTNPSDMNFSGLQVGIVDVTCEQIAY